MDLSRNFFIGIKSEKSEAKAFEFSGPLIQMLIIRFFYAKTTVFSWNRNGEILECITGPHFRLAKVALINEWSLKDKLLRDYCRRSVMGFGYVATWKPLKGWRCTCIHICFLYLLKYCVYLLQAIQKFLDLFFDG